MDWQLLISCVRLVTCAFPTNLVLGTLSICRRISKKFSLLVYIYIFSFSKVCVIFYAFIICNKPYN